MDIELGEAVMNCDDSRLGTGDRLVTNPGNWELGEVVLHFGLSFGEDRIVERFFIDHECLWLLSAREC